MKKIIDYFIKKNLGRFTLALIIIVIGLMSYCVYQLAVYFDMQIILLLSIICLILVMLLFILSYRFNKTGLILNIIVCAGLVFSTTVVMKTNSFTNTITGLVEHETVKIVTLKDSSLTEESDLKDLTIGYLNTDIAGYDRCKEILKENNKTVKANLGYESMKKAFKQLQNKKIELLLLDPVSESELAESDSSYESKIKVLYSKNYLLEEAKAINVDITKEPFTIYLQGVDYSSSDINSTGRGDVNILLTINPNTKKVNMQVVPRDLYVYVPIMKGSSKLSWSGWWGGINSSISGIEKEFGIKINYYAKINFQGITDVINQLGGIDVYSHYDFTTTHGLADGSLKTVHFKKGMNTVNGDEALVFARSRKMLPNNELDRSVHHMEIVKGIINKFAENPSYDKAMAILSVIENNFATNLPKEDFLDAYNVFAKVLPELQTMENHSIEGTYEWHDDEVKSQFYKYYFHPNEGESKKVKSRIDAVLNDK